jgi:hypothetical protein
MIKSEFINTSNNNNGIVLQKQEPDAAPADYV